MKTKILATAMVGIMMFGSGTSALAENEKVERVSGKSRIETSVEIAKQVTQKGSLQEVILTSSKNFPDSLGGSILSGKSNAPILLVGKDHHDSKVSLDFIYSNLPKNGKITILGSESAVSNEIVKELKNRGYQHIHRVNGKDRYETNLNIIKSVNVNKGTPFILATGSNFPDALSMSSVSSMKGYPIMLTKKEKMTNEALALITSKTPSVVYVAGSEGAVSPFVVEQIKKASPTSQVKRLGGSDRYKTSNIIANEFKKDFGNKAVLATGQNFPDALAGSTVASKEKAPILLVRDSILPHEKYLVDKDVQRAIILGGDVAVSKQVEKELVSLFQGYEGDPFIDFDVIDTKVTGTTVLVYIETPEKNKVKIKRFSTEMNNMVRDLNEMKIEKLILDFNNGDQVYSY